MAHTPLGALFSVDPRTGASRQIELTGGSLIPGTPDGILLDGHTIWVVQNFANQVAEIRLSPDLSSGQILTQITNADVAGRFRIPTTLAEHGNRLAIVNSRFDLGLPPPLGTGVPRAPTTTWCSSPSPDPAKAPARQTPPGQTRRGSHGPRRPRGITAGPQEREVVI